MLLHYLKLPSVFQYWLFSVAGIHSLTEELYKEQYKEHFFNNLNSVYHKVLERKRPSGMTPWNN